MSTRTVGSITKSILQLNGLIAPQPAKAAEGEKKEYVNPIITKAGFAKTLDNYRLAIKKHNMKIWMENAPVRDYNREVIRNRKIAIVPLEQKIEEQTWKESRKGLSPEEYNAEVEKYNVSKGPQLRKKNLRQSVKPLTEKFFVAFLHQYNMQLFNRKKYRTELEVHVPGELPKFDLYPNKIVESERNGCRDLPVSVDTVLHHRKRLEEAGVLTDYQYRGSNRAVKIAFSPEILSLTDNRTPRNRVTENQTLTRDRTDKVGYNNVSSRNHELDKYQVRDKGNSQKSELGSSCTKTNTEKPKRQKNRAIFKITSQTIEKNKTVPREKEYTISEILAANLETKSTLAKELSAGKHNDYVHLSAKIVQHEAFHGSLHPDVLKEIIIQDIFKYSAVIFAGLSVYPGSWMNAIKLWMALKFISFTGKTLNKPNLYEDWLKTINILNEVRKFKENHPEWYPVFPSLYFDPARKFKENNSFEYALQHFRIDTKKVESYEKRKANAERSKRHKTNVKKAQERIRLHLRGKISLDNLYDYVKFSCGPKVFKNIANLIKKEFENHGKTTANS